MSLFIESIGFGLVSASILAIAAVGFTLQFGVSNILNLAYAEVMSGTAFLVLLINEAGVNIWLCLPMAAVIGGIASVILNRCVYVPFIRRGTKLFAMIIVTVSVALIIEYTIQAVSGPSFHSYSMPTVRDITVAGMQFTVPQLVILGLSVALMLAVHLLLRHTKLGKAMRATAANPALARCSGIATDRVVDVAWLVSGGLCGIAGVVLFMNTTSFDPTTVDAFLIPIIAAAVLGGVGHPYGAMLGALTLGLASEIAATVIEPSYRDVVAFVILVLVLLLRPQGIVAEATTAREVTT